MLPVFFFFVNLQTYSFIQVLQACKKTAKLHDARKRNVHDDVYVAKYRPPPNLNFIFYAQFGAKLPNLKTAKFLAIQYMLLTVGDRHMRAYR